MKTACGRRCAIWSRCTSKSASGLSPPSRRTWPSYPRAARCSKMSSIGWSWWRCSISIRIAGRPASTDSAPRRTASSWPSTSHLTKETRTGGPDARRPGARTSTSMVSCAASVRLSGTVRLAIGWIARGRRPGRLRVGTFSSARPGASESATAPDGHLGVVAGDRLQAGQQQAVGLEGDDPPAGTHRARQAIGEQAPRGADVERRVAGVDERAQDLADAAVDLRVQPPGEAGARPRAGPAQTQVERAVDDVVPAAPAPGTRVRRDLDRGPRGHAD